MQQRRLRGANNDDDKKGVEEEENEGNGHPAHCSNLSALVMRVDDGSQSSSCHSHVYLQIMSRLSHLAFTPQPHSMHHHTLTVLRSHGGRLRVKSNRL